ncbi:general stress protein 26 [Nocardiopsis sp. Huas11]|uniref:pyridoxamine 5'-phosphate oxidase family protein n=1 Tax=Nocardiopsis sp. Huas11 TaxID=2183912 RepID=UPI000EB12DEA|nr:pyridoxamine 5'-phosphate oxidase family protein [Nocardiopsis sp. Huas11]RKS10702.1 general stress protein 26 [Nocardiopsis sp. Huas11]
MSAIPDAQPSPPFDVDAFLERPLVARVATVGTTGSPAVRPVWFLWESGALWWPTGSYSVVAKHVQREPRVSVVVDTCDLERMEFLQVNMRGTAEVVSFDRALMTRLLRRYLGDDETAWHEDFRSHAKESRLVRFTPERTRVQDLSKDE